MPCAWRARFASQNLTVKKRPRVLALFCSVALYGQEHGNSEPLAALQKQGCAVLRIVRANWRFLKIGRAFKVPQFHAFNQLYVLNFLIGLILSRKPMENGVAPDRVAVIYNAPLRRAGPTETLPTRCSG